MRLHRFFIEEKIGEAHEIAISDTDLLNQWKNVFRLGAGDRVILLDNSGFEFEAEFKMLARAEAVLAILARKKSLHVPVRNLTLLCSLVKKDKFELVLEKGTELGVSMFVPIISERSEKKDLNIERAKKIIKEASEQSERGMAPELYALSRLEEALENAGMPIIVFDPTGDELDRSALKKENFGILIGPEGGWSERELSMFKDRAIPIYSLGPQILRAETAAVAAAALSLL